MLLDDEEFTPSGKKKKKRPSAFGQGTIIHLLSFIQQIFLITHCVTGTEDATMAKRQPGPCPVGAYGMVGETTKEKQPQK